MLGRTGCGLDHSASNLSRSVPGYQHARAGRLRRPDHSAQVVWILNLIEGHEKSVATQYFVRIEIWVGINHGGYPLMILGLETATQFRRRYPVHRRGDAPGIRAPDAEFSLQIVTILSGSQQDHVHMPAPPKCLAYGIAAIDQIEAGSQVIAGFVVIITVPPRRCATRTPLCSIVQQSALIPALIFSRRHAITSIRRLARQRTARAI
jgi:hypothetical protein